MIAYLAALGLSLLALVLIVLQKTYYYFPARELKRQARARDHEATVLYKAVAYGSSLRLLLWLLIGTSLAGSFVLYTIAAPTWLVFLAMVGLLWYGFAWAPNARVGGLGARLTLLLSPAIAWILYYLHPVLDKVSRLVERRRSVTFHTGLYERDDLIELIKNQRDLHDSRIDNTDLDLVLHALSFGNKTVQSIMVPRRLVKTVHQADVIGPILMDELYDSKFSRFPVVSDDQDTLVGMLYLRDLISARHGGLIKDVMKPTIHYVHEEQSLYQVLHAFLKTKQRTFAVISSDKTYVGMVTIEDIIEQILGQKLEHDFDAYEDAEAVAGTADLQVHRAADQATEDVLDVVDAPSS